MFDGDNRKAFTLAEVLITLGIIGVVAALTIPTLITNYQKKVTVERLREDYAQILQAAKLYEGETGEDISTFNTQLTPKEFMEQYFMPYLKVVHTCESVRECYPNDIPLAIDKKTKIIVSYMLELLNGTYVGVVTSVGGATFYIDVNGSSKPNVSGKDIFNLYLFNSGTTGVHSCDMDALAKNVKSGIYPGGYGSCFHPFTLYKRSELLSPNSGVHRACSSKTTNVSGFSGDACAAVIMKDGWKISKDYPW